MGLKGREIFRNIPDEYIDSAGFDSTSRLQLVADGKGGYSTFSSSSGEEENYLLDWINAWWREKGKKTPGVYVITNRTTGDCYVGQSSDCEGRIRTHLAGGEFKGNPSHEYEAKIVEVIKNSRLRKEVESELISEIGTLNVVGRRKNN